MLKKNQLFHAKSLFSEFCHVYFLICELATVLSIYSAKMSESRRVPYVKKLPFKYRYPRVYALTLSTLAISFLFSKNIYDAYLYYTDKNPDVKDNEKEEQVTR